MHDCTSFTESEISILLDLACGKSIAQMARERECTKRSIDYQLESIRQKSYSTSNTGAVAFALLFGYVDIEAAKDAYTRWQRHLVAKGLI